MKFDPKDSKGEHHQQDAGEGEAEYDKDGKMMKGGGYYKGKDGKMMKKSEADLSGDELQKSLDLLGEFAESGDAQTRKEGLLEKAGAGELSKAENEELFQILGGGGEPEVEPTVSEAISKSLTDNEPLQKAVDVSGYLQENHDALVKSLDAVGAAIGSSDSRHHEFSMLQAKALVDIGTMVKSMAHVLDTFVEKPAGGPRSRGIQPGTKVLNKSFSDQPPDGEKLNKSMVMDGLDSLMEESMSKGMGGRLSETNEDINLAVSKFETSGQISPTMLEAVKRLRGAGMGASH